MGIKSSVYLDTSVINFLFADDAPEKMEITKDFFENFIKLGIYDTYISEYVIQEINKTQDEARKQKLLNTITKYALSSIELNDLEAISNLASLYLKKGILPEKSVFDALHVACSVISKID